jgi:hypothetical protein
MSLIQFRYMTAMDGNALRLSDPAVDREKSLEKLFSECATLINQGGPELLRDVRRIVPFKDFKRKSDAVIQALADLKIADLSTSEVAQHELMDSQLQEILASVHNSGVKSMKQLVRRESRAIRPYLSQTPPQSTHAAAPTQGEAENKAFTSNNDGPVEQRTRGNDQETETEFLLDARQDSDCLQRRIEALDHQQFRTLCQLLLMSEGEVREGRVKQLCRSLQTDLDPRRRFNLFYRLIPTAIPLPIKIQQNIIFPPNVIVPIRKLALLNDLWARAMVNMNKEMQEVYREYVHDSIRLENGRLIWAAFMGRSIV